MLTAAVSTKRQRDREREQQPGPGRVDAEGEEEDEDDDQVEAELKAPVRTVESGITRRGNWVLRTTPSWATTEVTALVVDSWKKVKRTIPSSSITG